MKVGIPKEIKNNEYRVGMTHFGVKELVNCGHEVIVQTGCGLGSGFTNEQYIRAGAKVVDTAEEVFEKADMIVKVKEPLKVEYERLRADQILFTYLHLAAEKELTQGLLESGAIAIAYETVTDRFNRLPLLAPMSLIAGRMSAQIGAHYLEKTNGGAGTLLSGAPGVLPGKVVIVGGGVVGVNAMLIAMGLGAEITLIDKSVEKLNELSAQYGSRIKTLYSTEDAIVESINDADILIGAALIPGATAPKIIKRSMIKAMKHKSVVLDVAIDQGGCFETSRPTSHENPVYEEEGVIHYCVTNMPGAVSRTSTFALTNATLPYVLQLANQGWKKALQADKHLLDGLNICQGKLNYQAVAEAFNLEYTKAEMMLV